MNEISRRRFIAGASILPLAAAVPGKVLARALKSSKWRFFTEHQAAVVREATARLIPGPQDDPSEVGHPGAREANVVRFIDTALGAFALGDVPRIFSGGPWSKRAGGSKDYMTSFVPLSQIQRRLWVKRIGALQKTYARGIKSYDQQANGDFTKAAPAQQDLILSRDSSGFRDVLFTNAIEGMYSNPEYGGNQSLAGWKDIQFPGDSQPKGYTAKQVSSSDGPDPVLIEAIDPLIEQHFEQIARALVARRRYGP
jgi:gluconate 2-dehydrogenase gamma chain